jgi:hypothetical protein
MMIENTQLYDYFRKHAAFGRLHDPIWLASFLQPLCLNARRGWGGGSLRVMQDPVEFAQWLILLSLRRCQSYFEVGVNYGGSLFVTDSYLRATVPRFQKSVGVDVDDRRAGWDRYAAKFPVEFRRGDSHRMEPLLAGEFDAALVDGLHTRRSVQADFKLVRNCRVVGFHDVRAKSRSVYSSWQQIRQQHPDCRTYEFTTVTVKLRWMKGIAAIELSNPPPRRPTQ